jgi:hypothetical protein
MLRASSAAFRGTIIDNQAPGPTEGDAGVASRKPDDVSVRVKNGMPASFKAHVMLSNSTSDPVRNTVT